MKDYRRALGCLAVLLLIFTIATAGEPELSDEQLDQWAGDFMQKALVIDTHCDTLMSVVDRGYDLSQRHDQQHIDIPRLLEGGVNGQFFACFVYPQQEKPYSRTTLAMIDAFHTAVDRDQRLLAGYCAGDIVKAHEQGKVAGILAVEGGHAIEDDLALLRIYHRLGVRYMTLTWMNNNSWADASGPDQSRWGNIPNHGGLTDFGREVIREMNRLGMIVDVSHVSDETFWDVLEVTDKPVIASHSCVWALNPHYRNLKDDMLKALARNGGVIGLNFAAGFLSREYNQASQGRRQEMMAKMEALSQQYQDDPEGLKAEREKLWAASAAGLPPVPISALADHIEHVVTVAGYDSVGLGSDFDGIRTAPQGLDDATCLYRIVVELKKRGWSDDNLRKLLGLNSLRVMKANTGC